MRMPNREKILKRALVLLVALFAAGLFKNIAYPLIWQDESETVMFADRILHYGYPKVHDAKNTVCMPTMDDNIADKRTDAYIGASCWGHFYFAAIGAWFATFVSGIYAKTALLRIPFALIGCAGLALMTIAASGAFPGDRVKKLIFLCLFVFFEILSVPLVLHMKEARYYPMLIFLAGAIFYVYLNYRFFKKINRLVYIAGTASLLAATFHTYTPAYPILAASIGLYELVLFLKSRRLKDFLINISPLAISLVPAIPSALYFRIFETYKGCSDLYNMDVHRFAILQYHAIVFFKFFYRYDFLALAAGIKCFSLYARYRYAAVPGNFIDEGLGLKMRVSDFLTLFFIVYFLTIINVPLAFFYQRFFIALQPVLTIVMLLDLFIIISLLPRPIINKANLKTNTALLCLSAIFLFNMSDRIEPIKGRIYEIFHQYKGPLDYAIPYIKENYKDTANLVIATNYEEFSYMYYLRSKVIIGFARRNLDEEMKMQPDIVIYRKGWSRAGYWEVFDDFLKKAKYSAVVFPVLDYPVNYISQMPVENRGFRHFYKTLMSPNDEFKFVIYVKK